jgi:hypothetical protein
MGNLRPFKLFRAAFLKALKNGYFTEKTTKWIEARHMCFKIKNMSEKYRIWLIVNSQSKFQIQIQVLSRFNAVSEFAVFAILYENQKSFRIFLISKNIQTFWTGFVCLGI